MESLNYLENNARDITVLYVDDEHQLLEETKQLLEKIFDVVDIAHNGAEGLELYRVKGHDIVITDIKMPVMDGVDMIRQIQEIKDDQLILVTSAYDFSDNLHPFLKHDVTLILLNELLDALVSLVRQVKQHYHNDSHPALAEEVAALRRDVSRLREEVASLKDLMNLPPL